MPPRYFTICLQNVFPDPAGTFTKQSRPFRQHKTQSFWKSLSSTSYLRSTWSQNPPETLFNKIYKKTIWSIGRKYNHLAAVNGMLKIESFAFGNLNRRSSLAQHLAPMVQRFWLAAQISAAIYQLSKPYFTRPWCEHWISDLTRGPAARGWWI